MENLVNPVFWKDRRVLVTGHTGFKGSWLCLALQNFGARLRGYALPAQDETGIFNAARIGGSMDSILADIRDFERVCAEIADFQPEFVFHLAAQPIVRQSFELPVETYSTNVMGTVHLLEAARRVPGIGAVICVTSDKCYAGGSEDRNHREDDPLGGHDPYSASKACAEMVIASYQQSYFGTVDPGSCAGIASVRAGNVIGGGDWSRDRLLPDLIRGFSRDRTVKVRNPEAIRPWQHVLEAVVAYIALAECLFQNHEDYSGAWNIGPRDRDMRTVREIVELTCDAWGDQANWVVSPEYGSYYENPRLTVDISKARSRLGWSPRWSCDEAVLATVDWYRAAERNEDMFNFSRQQLTSYLAT